MIIGGVGGVFRTGPGGSKVGYSETFFPIVVTVGTESVDAAFVAGIPIEYSASARIRNVADTGWTDLVDVVYFMASGSKDGSGSLNLTIRKTDSWSISSISNPDLLRPSQRILQVFCAIKFRGATYTVPMFTGQIQNYNESHGQSGGAITLTVKTSTIALENRPLQGIQSKTAYRIIYDELAASGLFSIGQAPIMMFDDYTVTTTPSFFSLLDMIEGLAPVAVDVSTRASGGVMIQKTGEDFTETSAFSIQDGNLATVTRSVGSAASYNRIIVVGDVAGTITTQTVEDATDITRRGVVQYPYRYGLVERDLTLNVADAESWLAEMLRGKLSAQMQMNPFIVVGTIMAVDSDRLFIVDGTARVGSFTHQYGHGQATTTISDMAVLT